MVQSILGVESGNSPEECVASARKVSSFIASTFGLSIKDLPKYLQTKFEEFGKKPPLVQVKVF